MKKEKTLKCGENGVDKYGYRLEEYEWPKLGFITLMLIINFLTYIYVRGLPVWTRYIAVTGCILFPILTRAHWMRNSIDDSFVQEVISFCWVGLLTTGVIIAIISLNEPTIKFPFYIADVWIIGIILIPIIYEKLGGHRSLKKEYGIPLEEFLEQDFTDSKEKKK